MLHIRIPVIVEGKYDKARLAQVIDGPIITTDGFGIFNNTEKTALIRQLGRDGVILLCDSDGGGKVIRGYLKGVLPPEKVYDLYVPQVAGKERRKRHGSKAGFLGVEGIDNGVLTGLFTRLTEKHPEILRGDPVESAQDFPGSDGRETDPVEKSRDIPTAHNAPITCNGAITRNVAITKTDLYLLGLTGGENSAERRDRLCRHLGFPADMTPNALLAALNILYSRDRLAALCEEAGLL